MNYLERLKESDALALVEMLAEHFSIKRPHVRFNARNRRGYHYPRTKTISVPRSVPVMTVAHEFAHYLEHVETGRSHGRQSNDRGWHSQGFYYKLRKVVLALGPGYPWNYEYKQIARWGNNDKTPGL